jgi:hypothetical protein
LGQKLKLSSGGSVSGGQVEMKGRGNGGVGLGAVDDKMAVVVALVR